MAVPPRASATSRAVRPVRNALVPGTCVAGSYTRTPPRTCTVPSHMEDCFAPAQRSSRSRMKFTCGMATKCAPLRRAMQRSQDALSAPLAPAHPAEETPTFALVSVCTCF